MALKDLVGSPLLEEAHQRWREDINADVVDIMIKMREKERQEVEKAKENLLLTWFLSLYNYDAEQLQQDITKLLMLHTAEEISREESRRLLRVLWNSIQYLFPDMDYAKILNEAEHLASFHRSYPDDGDSPFSY